MKALEDFFRSSRVFASLSVRDRHDLAAAAREESYRAREYVFMEGDPALWFCLVRTGRVKIVRETRGGKAVVLDLLGPGEPFGGVAVIERRPYPASAQAIEPSVIVKVAADAIVSLTERDPTLLREIALMMGERLRAAHDSVRSLAVEPAETRLASALLRLAEREGAKMPRGVALPFHLTRQSLADMAGTTVETAIRVVSRWLKEGLVAEQKNRLVVTDLEALRERAEGESD
jgi:CRP/FNR family transcriptional regulator